METVKAIEWLDRSAGRFLVDLRKSPAWYLVTGAGAVAVILTTMLFFSIIANNDPTIAQLAARTRTNAVVTRESMELAGEWTAQDKWRIAHFFLEHRAPRKAYHHLDHEDLAEELLQGTVRPRSNQPSRFGSFSGNSGPGIGGMHSPLPDTDVRLDLNRPKFAEQPKRLISSRFVRDFGVDPYGRRSSQGYRSRDSRLLVHAEFAFPDECYNEPRRHPITRRIIPVPEPQWDDRPPMRPEIPDNRFAELDVTMSLMREFLPAVGELPPRSHITVVTAHSEFPDLNQIRQRSSELADDSSPWMRANPARHQESDPEFDELLGGRTIADSPNSEDEEFIHDIELNRAPSFAEVALRLDLQSPEAVVAGRAFRSTLVAQNEGTQPIEKIWVREPRSSHEADVDANGFPSDRHQAIQGLVERKIRHLAPGKNGRAELISKSDTLGNQQQHVLVTAEAAVGASTIVVAPENENPFEAVPDPVGQPMPSIAPEPVSHQQPATDERPGLSFDVKNRPRALVDDTVEIEITVRNTGDVLLHHVRVQAELPQELKHRQGPDVEYVMEELPVGASELAVLRVVAGSSGTAVCRLVASADERVEAKSNAVVQVDAKSDDKPRMLPIQTPRPVPQPAISSVTPKRAAPEAPRGNTCCCQSQRAISALEYPFGP